MIARGLIDISTLDLLATFYRQASKKAQKESLLPWHNQAKFSLYSFSERTAFDAILQQLALAKKSDIIFTAYNIADFFTLAKHHQLNAIPCDINLDTLSPTNEQLEAALTPNTKAIVVAHLFGSRINMDCIAAFAKKHKLKIIEDCAQSYAGDKYLGHAQTDYTLFSFGPIKTATCLGGALIHCKDKEVANELSALQANYPQQSNSEFQQKVKKFLKVKWLSKPNRLAKFKKNCELKNEDFDDIISHIELV